MIASIAGKIQSKGLDYLVVETNGIGYQVFAVSETLVSAKTKQEVQLFTHQYIREDTIDLYGFKKEEELDFFKMLISISGIGPKAGIRILSRATVEEIRKAIASGDLDIFTSTTGIGRKKASHIILELRPKLEEKEFQFDKGILSNNQDLVEALVSLGYRKSEISKVISKIPDDLKKIEDKIKWALQNL